MIDDEKIRIAANKFCDYGSILESGYRVDGFKKGAHWALEQFQKDLWHDAKEEPMSNSSPILFDGRNKEGEQIVKTSFFRISWAQYCEYYGIVRWAYLEDLLPKEEEVKE